MGDGQVLALEHFLLQQKAISPSAVLLDDKPPAHNDARLKMAFLGIRSQRYFQVPAFTGKEDLLTPNVLVEIKGFLVAASR